MAMPREMCEILTKISQGTDFLRNVKAFLVRDDGFGWRSGNGIMRFIVIIILFDFPEITFQSDQDDFDTLTVFGDFRYPFCTDVLQGVLVVDLLTWT